MNDFDKLKQAKKMLEDGISEFTVAEQLGLSLPTITELRISLQQKIQTQAIANRLTLRQSFRNKMPKALDKAIEIINMSFDEVAGKECKDHIAFLKVQLDASKAILSLANQAVGEDFLSLYVEKPERKRENVESIFTSIVNEDGSTVLKATTKLLEDVEEIKEVKEEIKEIEYNIKEVDVTIDFEN